MISTRIILPPPGKSHSSYASFAYCNESKSGANIENWPKIFLPIQRTMAYGLLFYLHQGTHVNISLSWALD
jgi:hypothetical protein